jgi:dTDP-4-amino-4,6-dideoxygalactose transaminase
MSGSSELAILGGRPVRERPFPAWPVFGEAEEKALVRALRSGEWGRCDGQEVATFERRFAAFCGAGHAVAVANGTVSLRIALLAAGLQAGDEVIVPPYTFIATASAVVEANGTPVFADIDPRTFNIDPRAVERAITPRTRAIIPVHMGGLPADMDAMLALARRRGLTVIEDAAHAHGSELEGRRAGSLADLASFSFQSSKNLTAGEGGIITTSDGALAERCVSFHNCGRVSGGVWYEHHLIGGNYRLGEFQGAILNAQLDRLEAQIETRDRNGKYLAGRLREIPGILPQERGPDCTRHAYHLFLYRIDPEAFGLERGPLHEALRAEGVPASDGYVRPLYRQPLFLERNFGPFQGRGGPPSPDYRAVSCPACEAICASQGAWLEQRLLLGSREDMDDIVRAFEKVHEGRQAVGEWARARNGPAAR